MTLAKLIHFDDRRMADRGTLVNATLRDAEVRPGDIATNVYRLPASFDSAGPREGGETYVLPVAARVAIIISSSALLWLGIIALTVLIRAALR